MDGTVATDVYLRRADADEAPGAAAYEPVLRFVGPLPCLPIGSPVDLPGEAETPIRAYVAGYRLEIMDGESAVLAVYLRRERLVTGS